ncbi:MAG: electron transfer flavoprotein subunit beta/FixA family protein [bacterium]
MKIICCIKQVPETGNIKINAETNNLIRTGVESILNPFDAYAIEEALRIKERGIEAEITVITMGPPQAEQILREAISLGVDRVVLLSDSKFAGADTLATSYTLAHAIKKLGAFDLIICGKQAIDGDTAQVGPELAEILDIPLINYVRKIEEIRSDLIVCERLLESGYEVMESSLPALMTVVKEINVPRLPSLRGKMKARKAEIDSWKAEDLSDDASLYGSAGSPTRVVKIFTPEQRTEGMILKGDCADMATQLAAALKEALKI